VSQDRHNALALARPVAAEVGKRRPAMVLTAILLFVYILVLVLFGQNPKTETYVMPVAVALIVVYLVEVALLRRSLSVPAPLVWFVAYLGFSMFQMIWSPGSVGTLVLLMEIFVLSLVIVNHEAYGGNGRVVEYSFYFAVLCTFVYNLFSHEVPLDGRIGSTLVNANGYAQVLMFGVIFALRQWLVESAKRRVGWKMSALLLAFLGLCLYGIVELTGSRKGIIMTLAAVLLVAVYWVWHQPIRRRLLVTVLLVIGIVAAGFGLYLSPQTERITEVSAFLRGQNVEDTGLAKRSGMLEDAVSLWLQRPFTGWGLDQFRNVSGWNTYSHDNYVELLADQGIIGCLLYIMVYISTLVSLLRSLGRSRDAGLSADIFWAMVVIVVAMGWDIGAVSYYDRLSWIVLSMAIAVSLWARNVLHAQGLDSDEEILSSRMLTKRLRGRR
jgi:O-antigen ligase